MTKEERIAMIDKENIGGWWTGQRITAVISMGIFIAIGYRALTSGTVDIFLKFGIPIYLVVFLIGLVVFIIVCLIVIDSQRVSKTDLEVKEIKKNGKEIKVLGKDGKTHTIKFDPEEEFNQVKLNLNKAVKTYVALSGCLDGLWIKLVIGKNINEIWK